MGVGSAGDEANAAAGKRSRERDCIGLDLRKVGFEVRREGFAQADRLCGDDLRVDAPLYLGENRRLQSAALVGVPGEHDPAAASRAGS